MEWSQILIKVLGKLPWVAVGMLIYFAIRRLEIRANRKGKNTTRKIDAGIKAKEGGYCPNDNE